MVEIFKNTSLAKRIFSKKTSQKDDVLYLRELKEIAISRKKINGEYSQRKKLLRLGKRLFQEAEIKVVTLDKQEFYN